MKGSNSKILFLILVFLFPIFLFAAKNPEVAFKKYADFKTPEWSAPRVVDLNLENLSGGILVYDKSDKRFIPSLVIKKQEFAKPFVVSGGGSNPEALTDGRLDTYSEFDLNEADMMQRSEIVFDFGGAVKTQGFKIYLPDNVRLPNKVLVYDMDHAKILLNNEKVTDNIIRYPETESRQIAVRFEHIQPLRIAEFEFLSKSQKVKRSIRFLALPNHEYRIYAGKEYHIAVRYGSEMPNLEDEKELFEIKESSLSFVDNSAFKEPDSDNDGVIDKFDNCVNVKNPDQKDIDKNGRGDACDDFDRDGVINSRDNCPLEPNVAQTDSDRDGLGDVCDKEENRFFEKNKWLVWFAFGLVLLLFVVMFMVLLKSKPKDVVSEK